MDLYTLNSNFFADKPVDDYVSAIWTERFSAAGDFRIVTAATRRNIGALAEGRYLACRGSDDVGQVITQSIENGLLTVVGSMLTKAVLNERLAWFRNPNSPDPDARITNYSATDKKPGEFISYVVDKTTISVSDFPAGYTDANLEWALDKIPYLSLGTVDHTGTAQRLEIATGFVYDAIQPVAETNKVGIRLRLASADPDTGYSLKFDTYTGIDRTSAQSVNPVVRLSPNLETLSEIKEINSIDGFKNIAYIYYQGKVYVRYLDPDNPPEGLDRRVMVYDAQGLPVATGTYTAYGSGPGFVNSFQRSYVTPADITKFIDEQAKKAFAAHAHIHAVDGQTSPDNDFVYGEDYGLGDLIELQSFNGAISTSRVTEYIRAEDKDGDRAYPTIVVENASATPTTP